MPARPRPRAANRLGSGQRDAELRAGYQSQSGHLRQRGFVTAQYAVVYLVAGHGRHIDRTGRVTPLHPGCLFQRWPDQVHDVEIDDHAWYFLGVPAATVEILHRVGLPTLDQAVIEPGLDPRLVQRCERAIDHLADAPPTHLARCAQELQHLIVDLHLRAVERSGGGSDHAFVTRACALLDEHVDDRRPLAAIARELDLGYATFRKRFAEQVGVAPGTWRIRRRIERAQTLLADPALPIETIARRLGYGDVFAFSAQFKRHAGRSPSAFRRELG